MAVVFRAAWQNFAALGSAVLTASSTVSGRSVQWLRHQLRSKTWRSATGWTFKKGYNDILRIDEGTDDRIVYVTGEYTTGALAAAAVQAAITAGGIDPGELTPSLWLKADALQLADGADVTAWADSSGNARNLDTSVGTQTFVKSALNARPAVRFAQDGYLYAAANAVQFEDLDESTTGKHVTFTVAWVDSDHTGPSSFWATGSGGPATGRGSGLDASDFLVSSSEDAGGVDTAQGDAALAGGWHLFISEYDGTNVQHYEDNADTALDATVSGAQADMAQDYFLGGDNVDAAYLKGLIAEHIVFPTGSMTAENRRRVAAYLAQKYALTLGHTAPAWTNTYTCTYAAATSFTLARATGAATVSLMWTDADYTGRTLGLDLGFLVAADDTGATSYASDTVIYQSRHYIDVDLGSSKESKATIIVNHNDSGGTWTVKGNTVPFWEGSPVYDAAVTGDADILLTFFTAETNRYWRLEIDDRTNEEGFAEVGEWYVGTYFQPNKQFLGGFTVNREELSGVSYSDHGSEFMDDKPTLKGWRLLFHPVISTDKASFETMFDFIKTSRTLFVALDATDNPTDTHYGFLAKTPTVKHLQNSTTLYSISLEFIEAVK